MLLLCSCLSQVRQLERRLQGSEQELQKKEAFIERLVNTGTAGEDMKLHTSTALHQWLH